VGKLQEFLSEPAGTYRVIALTVNGEARRFEPPLNCQQLLQQLNLAGKRVALERNGEIVPRSRLGEQMLADGDQLEIVVAVGGG
jgi:sulfur carrier protein